MNEAESTARPLSRTIVETGEQSGHNQQQEQSVVLTIPDLRLRSSDRNASEESCCKHQRR